MADPIAIPKSDRVSRNGEFGLNYAFDAGFLSGEHPPDSPNTTGECSEFSRSSDSNTSEEERRSHMVASLRLFSESMMRMELAELEMVKAREAARLEAETRLLETEAELTRLVLKIQLQIASLVVRTLGNRKRKRSEEDDSSTSQK